MRSFRDVAAEAVSNIKRMDFALLAATSALSLAGIVTLIGGYSTFGLKRIVMQLGATCVGFVIMLLIATVDYRVIAQKLGIFIYGASLLLLVVTLVCGTSEGENKSWL